MLLLKIMKIKIQKIKSNKCILDAQCQSIIFMSISDNYKKCIKHFKIKMGGSSNSKPQNLALIKDIYRYDSVQKLIDSFQSVQIDHRIFTTFLFNKFDQNPHPIIGRMVVSNTHIVQQLFLVLTNRNKEAKLSSSRLKQQISRIYKTPQRAIQYSFRLIDLDDDKKITKAQFLNYFDNCFTRLLQAAQKKIHDEEFSLNFKSWIKSNKKVFAQSVIKIFQDNAKSSTEFWLMGDFTRWIKDKKYWSLDIQLGPQKIRTPLNLLCLFAIEV